MKLRNFFPEKIDFTNYEIFETFDLFTIKEVKYVIVPTGQLIGFFNLDTFEIQHYHNSEEISMRQICFHFDCKESDIQYHCNLETCFLLPNFNHLKEENYL